MAIGKNKRISKRKGTKKTSDPFLRKEWYDVRAPNMFARRDVGKLIVTKTIGKKLAKDGLLGRVLEVSLGDLKPHGEDEAFRKFRLKVEAVQGYNCLTQFYGMNLATDKLRALVRKWHTLIEAHVDAKTTDGYVIRMFCIAFTKRRPNQHKKTSYAQTEQVRTIRRKMTEIMAKEVQNSDLAELVKKLVVESIGDQIEKATKGVYPLQNVLIRKVKMLKSPKTDMTKLLDLHDGVDTSADVGAAVEREEPAEE